MRVVPGMGVLVAGLVGACLLLSQRPGLDPAVWEPPPNPGLSGDFAPNQALAGVQLRLEGVGRGPEDVAPGPGGWLYTGLEDGRILRFRGAPGGGHEVVARTGGRPLGLHFHPDGRLIVADARRGLLAVDGAGAVAVLCDTYGGRRLRLVDDLDVAADGSIYFSDASMRFGLEHTLLDIIEARPSGRLFRYQPASGRVSLLLEGLYFANGVALGPEDAYVLVAETGAGRIMRLWLKGARAGEHEPFVEALPAHPDNISYNGRGVFWVALPALRQPVMDRLAGHPGLRGLLAALPESFFIPAQGYAFALGIGTDGRVLHNLQAAGGPLHTITSVNEWGGRLYLGSLTVSAVGVLPAPGS